MQLLIIIAIVFALVSVITALPNGAPVCNIGAANVQNQHLRKARDPKTGTIESVGYQTILSRRLFFTVPTDPTFANLFDFGIEIH